MFMVVLQPALQVWQIRGLRVFVPSRFNRQSDATAALSDFTVRSVARFCERRRGEESFRDMSEVDNFAELEIPSDENVKWPRLDGKSVKRRNMSL